jgi:ABC-type cobalt transport system substrate-binding protein
MSLYKDIMKQAETDRLAAYEAADAILEETIQPIHKHYTKQQRKLWKEFSKEVKPLYDAADAAYAEANAIFALVYDEAIEEKRGK